MTVSGELRSIASSIVADVRSDPSFVRMTHDSELSLSSVVRIEPFARGEIVTEPADKFPSMQYVALLGRPRETRRLNLALIML
jgi:hypothetical protein